MLVPEGQYSTRFKFVAKDGTDIVPIVDGKRVSLLLYNHPVASDVMLQCWYDGSIIAKTKLYNDISEMMNDLLNPPHATPSFAWMYPWLTSYAFLVNQSSSIHATKVSMTTNDIVIEYKKQLKAAKRK